jgi:hypothetical protein
MVYYVEHNGGSVWFNELGPPWPKHPCFDGESKRANVQSQLETPSAQATEAYDRTARASKRCEFCAATLKLTHHAAHLKSKHDKITTAHNFTQHKAKHRKLTDDSLVSKKDSKKLRKVPPTSIPKASKVKKPQPALSEAKDLPATKVPARRPHASPGHPMIATQSPFDLPIVDDRNIKGTLPPAKLDGLGVVAPREPSLPSEAAIVLDKQGRRRCEFCTANVRPYNYKRHLAKEHGK